jgi:hypothetical protein
MKVILSSEQIERILQDLASRIIAQTPNEVDIATIGIRSRGEILAQRLSSLLSKELGKDVPCGTLDITLYRDDLNSPQDWRSSLTGLAESCRYRPITLVIKPMLPPANWCRSTLSNQTEKTKWWSNRRSRRVVSEQSCAPESRA